MTYSINSPEMTILLDWLKAARENKGLTMRDLSARLGKPHSYVQKVEQGERRLDVVEFVWYCEALELNPVQGIKLLMT
jgi:transcriptional regulator with XRE-family HTH domain